MKNSSKTEPYQVRPIVRTETARHSVTRLLMLKSRAKFVTSGGDSPPTHHLLPHPSSGDSDVAGCEDKEVQANFRDCAMAIESWEPWWCSNRFPLVRLVIRPGRYRRKPLFEQGFRCSHSKLSGHRNQSVPKKQPRVSQRSLWNSCWLRRGTDLGLPQRNWHFQRG